MSELTMPIMKASTEDLCYTHWFERRMEMLSSCEMNGPLFAALDKRMTELTPKSLKTPFWFKDYTTGEITVQPEKEIVLSPMVCGTPHNPACIDCGEWAASGGPRCEDCQEEHESE